MTHLVKPLCLSPGDKIAIVSLSSGILGEPFVAHQAALGEKRLGELGLLFEYMPNSRKGVDYIKSHPEARAADLKQAFRDPLVKGIICAIGGDDTYRTLPYLLDDPEFIASVEQNPKVFLGFSDTTVNHLMFYKLGLQTYYGQAFLPDFGEHANNMLPYTKDWALRLFNTAKSLEIKSSPVWYDERESFGPEQVGVDRVSHDEVRGFEVLRGSGVIEGELLGGCIDSLYQALAGQRYADQADVTKKYHLFPAAEEWKGKILFAETSEECPSPAVLSHMLQVLNDAGVFAHIKGIIVGKPQNEQYYQEYKAVWLEATERYNLPILYNINIGHATPRCIVPYGGKVQIDFDLGRLFLQDRLVSPNITKN